MKDIFKKYKKKKKISNVSIVVTSLILAIGINLLIVDGTDFGNTMKANVLEVKQQNQQSDIYAQVNNEIVEIYSNETINNVKNISMSISYNPNNVGILAIEDDSSQVMRLSDEKGIQSILINYNSEKDIQVGEKIVSIETSKLQEHSEQLNIFNANFTDTSGDNYLLSTSGITF